MDEFQDKLQAAEQFFREGQFDQAVACCHEVLQVDVAHAQGRKLLADIYNELGHSHHANNRIGDAAGHFAAAVKLVPSHMAALNNLSLMLRSLGQSDQAIAACRQAIGVQPDEPALYSNLALALEDEGLLEEAIGCYRKALALNPAQPTIHSNLLLLLNYDPTQTVQSLFDAHVQWGEIHGGCEPNCTHANAVDPQRRLRIGYVSPDYRSHPAVYFLEPILERYDREKFEVIGYGNVPNPDEIVQRLAGHCDRFHYVWDWSDQKLAQQIQDDGIDILVDLAGHTSDNRLTMFAMKPAPLAVTFLGYQNTTGLGAMDYRVTDNIADPPATVGEDEPYTEQLIRMKSQIISFKPPAKAPQLSPLPLKRNGFVTFGSHHRLIKLNPQVLDLWCKVMLQTPGSRLVIFPRSLSQPSMQRLVKAFDERGISAERLTFHHRHISGRQYLEVFDEVDVILDAFPTGAGATAYESLWMGVAMVTLRGESFAGRIGASLLERLGLGHLVAGDLDEYVAIACGYANDVDLLAELRATMRQRMQDSTLCDSSGFVAELECAYRDIWRLWCVDGGETSMRGKPPRSSAAKRAE